MGSPRRTIFHDVSHGLSIENYFFLTYQMVSAYRTVFLDVHIVPTRRTFFSWLLTWSLNEELFFHDLSRGLSMNSYFCMTYHTVSPWTTVLHDVSHGLSMKNYFSWRITWFLHEVLFFVTYHMVSKWRIIFFHGVSRGLSMKNYFSWRMIWSLDDNYFSWRITWILHEELFFLYVSHGLSVKNYFSWRITPWRTILHDVTLITCSLNAKYMNIKVHYDMLIHGSRPEVFPDKCFPYYLSKHVLWEFIRGTSQRRF